VVAPELALKMVQTVAVAVVQTVQEGRLVVLVVKASRVAMLVTAMLSIEVLAAEETKPQEQTAVAQLQTVALAVRTSTQLTLAAAAVALVEVLPELAVLAAVVLAAVIQR
jgi:hypothetical protein